MTWVAVGVGGATAIAGIAGSQSAANAQESAANKANKLTWNMYQRQQQQMQPFYQTGLAGNEMLSAYMGLDAPMLSRDQLMKQLAPQYTQYKKEKGGLGRKLVKGAMIASGGTAALLAASGKLDKNGRGKAVVNQKRLNEAVDKAMAEQQAKYEARRSNPNFGLLTKKFTNEDFVKDPGYDYRQSQGELGVNRGLASRGNYFSGAALKELNRFNQDFASNEFGNAAARDAEYKANMYNRLAGMSGGGLQAGQYLGTAGMGTAGQLGQNYMAGAQASGAGAMGGVNALADGVGTGFNLWAAQKELNKIK